MLLHVLHVLLLCLKLQLVAEFWEYKKDFLNACPSCGKFGMSPAVLIVLVISLSCEAEINLLLSTMSSSIILQCYHCSVLTVYCLGIFHSEQYGSVNCI